MFLREGSQLRATSFAILCAGITGMMGFAATVEAAGGWTQGVSSGVQLPREILPWRRRVEDQAYRLWVAAQESQRRGDVHAAQRQLRRLIREFPDTYAALDGQRELARLRDAQRQANVGRRGLGVPPRQEVEADHGMSSATPVAGWQTVVKPDPSNIREALIEAAGDRVFFDEGSARLSTQARAVLKKQARWLGSQSQVEVRIVGHADDSGTSEHNLRLSHDRVVAVRKRLIRYGVSPKRLHVFSHGRAQPIAICAVSTCAAQNRRVVTEIRLAPESAALR